MKYDFEQVFPPVGADSPRRRKLSRLGITDPDAVCYGVAEMKFEMLPEIREAVAKTAKDAFFGYSSDNPDYLPSLIRWMQQRHNFTITPDDVVLTHGVVTAIGIAVRSLTNEGDSIIIQTPVYNPFASQIKSNGRKVVENPLIRGETRYEIDFDDLAKKAAMPDVKMCIICSPHNPVGRVWSKQELEKIAKICCDNGVIVVSDEIHEDMVYEGRHTVFANLSTEAEQNCVICTSPSKPFNFPALSISNIIIKNPDLREKFKAEAGKCGHFMNPVGMAAGTAAFTYGGEWMDELCAVLKHNASKLRKCLDEYIPGTWMPDMEATYLAWVDFSCLGMTDEELKDFFLTKVKASLNYGPTYGTGGEHFVRIDIACPERYLLKLVKETAEKLREIRG